MWAGLREGQCHQPPAWGLGALCILWKCLRGSPHESDSEKLPAGPRPHSAPSTPAAECPLSWELSLPQPPPSVALLDAPEAGRLLGHPGDRNCGRVEGEWHRPRGCSVGGRLLQRWSCSMRRGAAASEHGQGRSRAPQRLPAAQGGRTNVGDCAPGKDRTHSAGGCQPSKHNACTAVPLEARTQEELCLRKLLLQRNKHPTSSSALWGVQDRTPPSSVTGHHFRYCTASCSPEATLLVRQFSWIYSVSF